MNLLTEFGSLSLFLILHANSQDVVKFTNHFESITNRDGRVVQAEFLRADLDGIIYRVEGGGGFLSFTNLSPAKLKSLGIPTNRSAIAAERAAVKAEADRRYRERYEAEGRSIAAQRAAQAAEDEKRIAAIRARWQAEVQKAAEHSRRFWQGVQQRREDALAKRIAERSPLLLPP